MIKPRDTPATRVAIIALLSLLLLIPVSLIDDLISERESRKEAALHEVSAQWGGSQTLAGPELTIPFQSFTTDKSGKEIPEILQAHFLPEQLTFEGRLTPEIRYRGIYEFVLYRAEITLSGLFSPPDFAALGVANLKEVLWHDATLNLGVRDIKGIHNRVELRWNEAVVPFEPGVDRGGDDIFPSGIHARPVIKGGQGPYRFSITLQLHGSEELYLLPFGQETSGRLAAPWSTPSFVGGFLPDAREIGEQGFTASWRVLHYNRTFPQQWVGSREALKSSLYSHQEDFGVSLKLPVESYQKATRVMKYALLVIVLTFLSFFIIEILGGTRVHPLQYLLVGFSVVLYYALLLAFSEHMPFNAAYGVASVLVVTQVTLYSRVVLRGTRRGLTVGGVLALFYLFIFILLQLEEYALLLGSLGLFAALGAVMYLTRHVDWFAREAAGTTNGP